MRAMLPYSHSPFVQCTPDVSPWAGGAAPAEDTVRRFAATLPVSYRAHFSPARVARHAYIAAARGLRCAHVDTFGPPSRVTPLCVVADDRPGLLWLISAALAAHRLDVVKAHVYCRRRPDGRSEALDLIWVRRASASSGKAALTANEISAIDERLQALILGHAETRESVAGEVLNPAVGEPDPARVTFVVDAESNASMLAIEAPDRPGLLLTITRALFEEGLQIARAEVATIHARALDTFYVMELDGGTISPERRAQILIAAQTALSRLYRSA